MPVVSEAGREFLVKHCPNDIQPIEAKVESQGGLFYIANVNSAVACIDERESEITWRGESDGRPDTLGTYQMIINAVLTDVNYGGEQLFGVVGWSIMLSLRLGIEGVGRGERSICRSRHVQSKGSIERTSSGKAPWPEVAQCHVAPRGQAALPAAAAHVRR